MDPIELIRPNATEVAVYSMPDVRVIGKAVVCKRNGGSVGWLWQECAESGLIDSLCRLPRVIPGSMVGWTGNADNEAGTFVYLLGVMTPAGTPVPEGGDHRDLPASLVAKGLYGKGLAHTVGEMATLGYRPRYSALGWNSELYLEGEELGVGEEVDGDWSWLVPCEKA